MSGRSDPVRAPSARGLWALGFVVVSLAALVAVPAYYGQQVAAAEARIAEVLQPAARLSSSLRLIKARQMARVERYLTTGDRSLRLAYDAARAEEDDVRARLRDLAREVDRRGEDEEAGREVSERVARLTSLSTDWHLFIEGIFNPGPAVGIPPMGDPVTRARLLDGYSALESATRELDLAIQSRVDRARLEMERLLREQSRVILGLALLAFIATLIVARVAYRYRSLTVEGEARRQDAVRARREVDALLEATGEGVLGVDLEGRCTSLNRTGEKLLGYTEGEIMGRDLHETLFHTRPDGTPAPREDSELVSAIEQGRPLDSPEDAVMWSRKRVSFPVRWSLRPMIDGRTLRGAVLTFTDMTETLERQKALRRAVRQREDVVSIVSHDLRNPLGVTLAAAELLLDLPLDEEQRRRQAEIIRRSGHRMQRLIDDLLDISRIDEGALVVRVSREDLRPILDEAAELFADQAEAKSLTLVVRGGDGGVEARVDRDRILQALSNLLDNAIRLTPEGGRVTLSAETDGGEVGIAVSDTGPGIDPDLVDTLFDRFAQSEGSDRGAAGLGLTIVKGVAEAHGGRVEVSTEPGEGSEFILRLPRADPSSRRGGAPDSS